MVDKRNLKFASDTAGTSEASRTEPSASLQVALRGQLDRLSADLVSEPIPLALWAAVDAALINYEKSTQREVHKRAGDTLWATTEASVLGYKLVEGWCAPFEVLPDGSRSLTHVYVPGDVIILRKPEDAVAAMNVVALSPVVASPINEADQQPGELAWAVARVLMNERVLLNGRIVGLGRRTAMQRMSLLLLELYDRTAAHQNTTERPMEIPLTQRMLADLLGLSTVHVNKSLSRLREAGVLDEASSKVVVMSREKLAEAAVDDGY